MGDPIYINAMFLSLKKEIQTSFKSVYLDAMEARVCFQPNPITQFGEIITQYNAWHHYVTEKPQVEVVELDFPRTQA